MDVVTVVLHAEEDRDHKRLASGLQFPYGVFHIPLRSLVGHIKRPWGVGSVERLQNLAGL